MEDQPSIRDGSEDLVSEPHIEISPDPGQSRQRSQPICGPTDHSDDSVYFFYLAIFVSPNQFEPQCHRPQPQSR